MLTHGGRYSREYGSWIAMKRRCEDTSHKDYPRWGGRGVTIFPPWSASFSEFRGHIGPRPPNTTLDRIDGRLGYVPGNVRWATPKQQSRNRYDTFIWHIKGRAFETITEAAKGCGVSEHTVWRWVNGQFDKRRQTMQQPRTDCFVVKRNPQ